MTHHFQQLYASMDKEELIDLQRRGTLRPEAEVVLSSELDKLCVTAIQRVAIETELKATSYEEQLKHLAPIGSRIIARLIDLGICLAIAVLVGFIVLKLPVAANHPEWLLLMSISFFGYLLFADCMPGGQIFGKKWNEIAVVDKKTHAHCTCTQSIGRNFLLAMFGIIDIALVLGHQGHRIGDHL
ncbi:MAG: RDD family protein [Burkholderiaceae bacterium]|nr:RDD family protein [Burkholderiaceae bacterium]